MIEDVKDYTLKLTDSERDFLTKKLRFLTQGDIDVSGAYVKTYLPQFPQPEIRMMLSSFAGREAVHIAAYSHLIETLGMPETVYNEFLQYEAMAAKHHFFEECLNDENELAAQIAAFSAFTEGMQLFSSFVMLLNFTRNGAMKGMGQIISWSIADETLHTDSMTKLFREYIKENPKLWKDRLKKRIYSIAETMVDLEDQFIALAFGVSEMKRLTKKDVEDYIRYIADRRLMGLGRLFDLARFTAARPAAIIRLRQRNAECRRIRQAGARLAHISVPHLRGAGGSKAPFGLWRA